MFTGKVRWESQFYYVYTIQLKTKLEEAEEFKEDDILTLTVTERQLHREGGGEQKENRTVHTLSIDSAYKMNLTRSRHDGHKTPHRSPTEQRNKKPEAHNDSQKTINRSVSVRGRREEKSRADVGTHALSFVFAIFGMFMGN